MPDNLNLQEIIEEFSSLTENLDQFLSFQDKHSIKFRKVAKTLYDLEKCSEPITKHLIKSALQRLIIKDFDEEQIWQQIELQNKPFLNQLSKSISALSKSHTEFKLRKKADETNTNEKKEKVLNKLSKEKVKNKNSNKNVIKKVRFAAISSSSVVDDRFFKLSELEEFLNSEDLKESKEQNDDDDSSDEDFIDYFEDVPSNSDDDDKISARNATYKDFFDLPNNEDVQEEDQMQIDVIQEFDADEVEEHDEDSEEQEDDDDDDDNSEEQNNDEDYDDDISSAFNEEESEGEEMEDNDMYDTRDVDDDEIKNVKGSKVESVILDESDDNEDVKDEPVLSVKSAYQKEQEKLKRKMEQLENEILSEKPWQLKGEITSNTRPENSLLEEDLQYDHLTRQAPAITEETTMKLEDIIKQRIKDKAWDDVERKQKVVEKPFEYKNAILMEKEKKSLAEVYEQDYIKKQTVETEEKESEKHQNIKKAMDSLFLKLDALSHFQFHPKPPVPEIKMVSNIPAITVEEAIPESVSGAALLAPEEIKKKMKGELKGKMERDVTDRKRERRKKKIKQKLKSKLKPKNKGKLDLDKKVSKKKKKQGKVSTEDSSNKKVLSSSKAFFSKLQEQVDRKSKT